MMVLSKCVLLLLDALQPLHLRARLARVTDL
jgi:hypothetical protein